MTMFDSLTFRRPARWTAALMPLAMILPTVAAHADVVVQEEEEHHHAHFDLAPYLEADQLVVGGTTHATDHHPLTGADTGTFHTYWVSRWRVFGVEFGETYAAYPHYVNDPGINSAPGTYRDAYTDTDFTRDIGTGLNTGTSLSLQILSGLQAWDDAGETFVTAPTGHAIELDNGIAGSVTVTPDSGEQTLLIKNFSIDDHVHAHLDSTLTQPGDLATWLSGVYLFEARFVSSQAGVAASESIWLVYNFGADEHLHGEAMAWVDANLVPEPTSLALWVMAGAAMLGRRRKPPVQRLATGVQSR